MELVKLFVILIVVKGCSCYSVERSFILDKIKQTQKKLSNGVNLVKEKLKTKVNKEGIVGTDNSK